MTDNFDKKVKSIEVDGTVDTKKDGETTLKITAKDSSGNASEETLKVKVGDLSAPKISYLSLQYKLLKVRALMQKVI